MISVITPSLNQAAFLEATLRSVLEQTGVSVEYIVIDGGSTDGSVEIIKRYADRLAYWESTPDRGQSHAINKGLRRATGDILCWLNSDDTFEPGTLSLVAKLLSPDTGIHVIAGNVGRMAEDGKEIVRMCARYSGRQRLVEYWRSYDLHQPGIFWRREVTDTVGLLDESLHLTMDFDYWLRVTEHFNIVTVDRTLARCLQHPGAKTGVSYVPYRRAQLRDVLIRFGSPFALKDWSVRKSLYSHLADSVWSLLRGRESFYRLPGIGNKTR